MSRPNSRSFQLRRAAEREAHANWPIPKSVLGMDAMTFRQAQISFMAGADWERRRWMKRMRARDLAYVQPRRGVYG